MILNASWHFYVMSAIYILAGCNHFIRPEMYLKIMPPYLPWTNLLNAISGGLEILAGLGLLFTVTKNFSIYLIIALLCAFFLVHIYMLYAEEASMGLPKTLLILRLLLQFGLIYWAYSYINC